jgi:hypothetical protein
MTAPKAPTTLIGVDEQNGIQNGDIPAEVSEFLVDALQSHVCVCVMGMMWKEKRSVVKRLGAAGFEALSAFRCRRVQNPSEPGTEVRAQITARRQKISLQRATGLLEPGNSPTNSEFSGTVELDMVGKRDDRGKSGVCWDPSCRRLQEGRERGKSGRVDKGGLGPLYAHSSKG